MAGYCSPAKPISTLTPGCSYLYVAVMLTRSPWSILLMVVAVITMSAVVDGSDICGDGQISGLEQCDDGNQRRLDGCAPDCTYEQVLRVTELTLSGVAAPAMCTPPTNAFGQAFSELGRTAINQDLATSIGDGSLDQLFPFFGLDDPLGLDDADFELGAFSGAPDPMDGGLDLDSWHLANPAELDGDDLSLVRLDGSLVAAQLIAGPGDLNFPMAGGTVSVREARLMAQTTGGLSLPAPPPEQLAAGFLAFEELDGLGVSQGLCGNATVGSLAATPAPQELSAGGDSECDPTCGNSRSYVYCGDGSPVGPDCNSLLDVLVSGCATRIVVCFALVHPTQPDVGVDPDPPHILTADPITGKVTVDYPDDAYSLFFNFTGLRVHVTNNLNAIFSDGFESGSTSAWSNVVP